jgi:hypothetical protein
MIEGGIDGASTQTGMKFERDTDLKTALLSKKGIRISGYEVFEFDKRIGYILQKHDLYRNFLERNNVDWQSIVSKKLLPDEGYFSLTTNKLIIIEKKYQQVAGSVDEKLQTCGFKKKQYEKLCKPLKNVKVEYVYILNDWFKDRAYKDVLEYIEEVGCRYYFNQLPYQLLGIEE